MSNKKVKLYPEVCEYAKINLYPPLELYYTTINVTWCAKRGDVKLMHSTVRAVWRGQVAVDKGISKYPSIPFSLSLFLIHYLSFSSLSLAFTLLYHQRPTSESQSTGFLLSNIPMTSFKLLYIYLFIIYIYFNNI